jgi:hypothetical protein
MAETETPLDRLKALPLIDRLILTMSTLDKLRVNNLTKSQSVFLTRKQCDDNMVSKGKAIAYRDTLLFLTQLFQDEVKAHLAAKPEVKNLECME